MSVWYQHGVLLLTLGAGVGVGSLPSQAVTLDGMRPSGFGSAGQQPDSRDSLQAALRELVLARHPELAVRRAAGAARRPRL